MGPMSAFLLQLDRLRGSETAAQQRVARAQRPPREDKLARQANDQYPNHTPGRDGDIKRSYARLRILYE